MTNINVIAVAVMADLSCDILTEGVTLDENAVQKALQNDVPVLVSDKNTFETCTILGKVIE